MENVITIYGTLWCGDCSWVRRYFDQNSIKYNWIDVDRDVQAAEFVISTNHGYRSVPTIVSSDGSILVEPSEPQLKQWLHEVICER